MGIPIDSIGIEAAEGKSVDDVRADMRRGWDRTTADVEAAVAERRFEDAMTRVGNEWRHGLLFDWWVSGVIDAEEMAGVILGAWDHGAVAHLDDLGSETWIEMFEETGFVADPPRPRPTVPTVIYRAQPVDAPELGMSWTTDRAVADWFRDRWERAEIDAEIWRASAPPHAVLGMTNGREEHEVIVSPSPCSTLSASSPHLLHADEGRLGSSPLAVDQPRALKAGASLTAVPGRPPGRDAMRPLVPAVAAPLVPPDGPRPPIGA